MIHAKTLKQVNAAIQKKYPHVELVKGLGYFYLRSDDEATALSLSAKDSTSIYIYALNRISVKAWVEQVDIIMKGNGAPYCSVTNVSI